MTTTAATRRLAAILAADVVGYSRLMGADEEGTHRRFKAHLAELIDPMELSASDGLDAKRERVSLCTQCAVCPIQGFLISSRRVMGERHPHCENPV